jgi:hypothetical protein
VHARGLPADKPKGPFRVDDPGRVLRTGTPRKFAAFFLIISPSSVRLGKLSFRHGSKTARKHAESHYRNEKEPNMMPAGTVRCGVALAGSPLPAAISCPEVAKTWQWHGLLHLAGGPASTARAQTYSVPAWAGPLTPRPPINRTVP